MQTLPQDCRLSSERLKLLLSTLPTAADICRHGFIEDSHRLVGEPTQQLVVPGLQSDPVHADHPCKISIPKCFCRILCTSSVIAQSSESTSESICIASAFNEFELWTSGAGQPSWSTRSTHLSHPRPPDKAKWKQGQQGQRRQRRQR